MIPSSICRGGGGGDGSSSSDDGGGSVVCHDGVAAAATTVSVGSNGSKDNGPLSSHYVRKVSSHFDDGGNGAHDQVLQGIKGRPHSIRPRRERVSQPASQRGSAASLLWPGIDGCDFFCAILSSFRRLSLLTTLFPLL